MIRPSSSLPPLFLLLLLALLVGSNGVQAEPEVRVSHEESVASTEPLPSAPPPDQTTEPAPEAETHAPAHLPAENHPAPAAPATPATKSSPPVGEHAAAEPIAETNHAAPEPTAEPVHNGHGESAAPAHAAPTGPDPKEIRKQIGGLQNLGVRLTERGDWDAAEIAFRQILAMRLAANDDLANALLGLARVYRRQGSLTKAAAIYERFLADYPNNDQVPDALLELGRTHRALGAHHLALARFYSVINSTLKVSGEGFIHYQMLAKTAQFEIAETHFQQGHFAEANKFFSRLRLLDLAPADRARAHFKSAYALYLDKNLEDTVTTLYSYLEQWPQDENVPEARNLLAISLRTLGRKQEALDATLQLLRTEQSATDPKRWAYWQRRTGNQLANDFFQNGDTLNALAIYQRLAVLAPEPAWSLPITYQIGLCYERLRDTGQASTAYQTIVDTAANTTPAVGPELTELARMAKWRLGQLAWQTTTDAELTNLFSQIPGATTAAATPTPLTNDTSAPAHDNPGNSSKTPSSL